MANCYKTKTFVLSLTNDHVVKESWKWKLLVSAIAFFCVYHPFLLTQKLHNECCIVLGTFCLLLDGSPTHQSKVKLSFIYVIQLIACIRCLFLVTESIIAWIYYQWMQINLYWVHYLLSPTQFRISFFHFHHCHYNSYDDHLTIVYFLGR